jgi:hypothetical protein
MKASNEEIAVSHFNQAVKDTSNELKVLKAFCGEGESNPNYPTEFLGEIVEPQA